ncbi:ferredoxin FdxA [Bradyrhizobium sp. NP1]|jgi:ferredoxin|uniref:ferredoxin FdxA n=1 Tax=Bradyrhizobium sp. NP1 TaxID=3049772 RepID=UPI0025A50CA6|nr:ferredoxin FdxA [Bradyrhizobium sp. NP1]WJR77919.1 ferredoxin family protein [Bradyrhizobium sp. NP1]
MTFVVTESCIRCKFQDCLQSCPATCFYEGENMLVINPEECIDCGACEPECPAEAIIRDTVAGAEKWVAFNRQYAAVWPKIRKPGEVPEDAEDWIGVEGKLETEFNPAPASR